MPPPPSGANGGGPGPPPPPSLAALALLCRARDAALELRLDPWEFAVSLTDLFAAGADSTVVRQLLAGGLAEHGHERVRPTAARRCIHRMANLALTARTCFVLTPAGDRFFKQWDGHVAVNGNGRPPELLKPSWDAARRQLWYRDRLVKWYRRPAESQETILAVFEEDSWPPRIDDPLPMVHGLEAKVRLHEAVKGLNRGQKPWLLGFRRDGSGKGVVWEGR
jgi:hypothetical protein